MWRVLGTPQQSNFKKLPFLTKNSHLRLKMRLWGLWITSNFCFNIIIIHFRFLWMHFDHGKSKIQIFNFWPFHGLCIGGLRRRWGLKTHFKFFLKGIFVQEGSSGTRFDHGQFEIKTFPIYALPYYTVRYLGNCNIQQNCFVHQNSFFKWNRKQNFEK